VWGMLNCLVILVSQELEPIYRRFRERFPKLTASYGYHCFEATRTFLLMGLIRSLDCYGNVGLTFKLWGSIFTKMNFSKCFSGQIFELGLDIKDYVILAVAIVIVAVVAKLSQTGDLREWLYGKTVLSWALSSVLLVLIQTMQPQHFIARCGVHQLVEHACQRYIPVRYLPA